MQICRTLCFLILSGITIGHLGLNCADHVNNTSFLVASQLRAQVEIYFRGYNVLRICATAMSRAFGGIIFSALTTVFMLTVIANYISIRMRGFIPTSIYIFFPVTGILAPTTIQFILSFLVAMNDTTNEILAKCKFHMNRSNDKKYVRRRVRSMKSICMHGEIMGIKLFKCCRSNRSEYLYVMLSYTVTALITWKKV